MAGTYPGGFVTKSPTSTVGPSGEFNEGGSASGMWTLDQALLLKGAGLWPVSDKIKYLYAWGSNALGGLGINSETHRSYVTSVGSGSSWKSIAAGSDSGAAIKTDGTMWAWGSSLNGQLGNGDRAYRSSPTQVGALTTWRVVARSDSSCYAIKTDGTLWAWGNGEAGALGDNTTDKRSSPVQIGTLTTWSKLSGGSNHCLAIKTDGTLWAWGSANSGKLGVNVGFSVPKSSPTAVGYLTTWSKIAAGGRFSAAIKTDGTLWTWGRAFKGALGNNFASQPGQSDDDNISVSSPVQVGTLTNWSTVSAGLDVCVATKTDGTLWAWGLNTGGELADNTVLDKSSPVQIGALTTWSSCSVSKNNTSSMAIKTSGTLWAWCTRQYGQLGDGTQSAEKTSSPVQVGGASNWAKVVHGTNHILGITVDQFNHIIL